MNRKQESPLTRAVVIFGIFFFIALLNMWNSGNLGFLLKNPKLQIFTIVITAILLEAIPFILIGAIISGTIEVFVSEEKIKMAFPQNRFLSAITGALLGILFPVCSCGNVVVARRLLKKGVPASGGLSYMLASPIINPITILSTFIAFSYSLRIVMGRILLAFISAVVASLILSTKNYVPLKECEEDHHIHHSHLSKVEQVFHHAESDFLLMGRYLVLGAFAAAIFQTFVSRQAFLSLAGNKVLSVFLMQILGILLSLCSFADAFVASSFVHLPAFSKIAFMVAGPMTNITVSILYAGTFKKSFVLKLILTLFITIFILGVIGTYITGGK